MAEIDDPAATPQRSRAARAGWVVVGCVAVAVGGVGIVVPGLPTTVFFIIAAWAFARSSPRLEAWVLNLPKVGPMVQDYRAGHGMPHRAKATAIVMIVVFVGLSAVLLDGWILRVIVVTAGAVGVLVVLRVPTKIDPPEAID